MRNTYYFKPGHDENVERVGASLQVNNYLLMAWNFQLCIFLKRFLWFKIGFYMINLKCSIPVAAKNLTIIRKFYYIKGLETFLKSWIKQILKDRRNHVKKHWKALTFPLRVLFRLFKSKTTHSPDECSMQACFFDSD